MAQELETFQWQHKVSGLGETQTHDLSLVGRLIALNPKLPILVVDFP